MVDLDPQTVVLCRSWWLARSMSMMIWEPPFASFCFLFCGIWPISLVVCGGTMVVSCGRGEKSQWSWVDNEERGEDLHGCFSVGFFV